MIIMKSLNLIPLLVNHNSTALIMGRIYGLNPLTTIVRRDRKTRRAAWPNRTKQLEAEAQIEQVKRMQEETITKEREKERNETFN